MEVKIYTKTGDKGTTRLVDGSCVEKFNPRVEAYGTVDEMNSYLGVVRAELRRAPELNAIDAFLESIQNQLFNLGSLLACADAEVFKKLPAIEEKHVRALENSIDVMTAELPPLKNFVLPAGHAAAAHLHVVRTLCRRAERRSAEVMVQDHRYDVCLRYLNRLSDYFFVAARWANLQTQFGDVLWKKSE